MFSGWQTLKKLEGQAARAAAYRDKAVSAIAGIIKVRADSQWIRKITQEELATLSEAEYERFTAARDTIAAALDDARNGI